MIDVAFSSRPWGSFPLHSRVRFAVRGRDALRYLNGQLSQEIKKLQPQQALPACVLSAKGKLEGWVAVWLAMPQDLLALAPLGWEQEESCFIIEADAILAESLELRLSRYLIADDVEIVRIPGWEGRDSNLGHPVQPEWHVVGEKIEHSQDLGILRSINRLGVLGWDLSADAWDHLLKTSAIPKLSAEQCEWIRIYNSVPKWGKELDFNTLPAEAKLDSNSVDFHKGCYVGQESVSRIRSLGHVNRTLESFWVVGGELPTEGSTFFQFSDPDQSLAGAHHRPDAVVTSVMRSPEHDSQISMLGIGLCYLKRGVTLPQILLTLTQESSIEVVHRLKG